MNVLYFSECNCHSHSNECYYDGDVDKKKLSLDTHGNFSGGGVCVNCQVCLHRDILNQVNRMQETIPFHTSPSD